ncbi:hypothetical protein ROA7450_03354 [Roseovarius albus]|uniref:Trypsin n=1 Tax=Roseovarius albus TaxID=1247867 RepID=A0A1X6ZWW3_9RHOB|nr:hypothetical protein ROA7450_03354 [Roseovarius albus]
MYLQSDLLRIVSFTKPRADYAKVEKLIGTAFLISQSGLFMTAAHVLKTALSRVENYGQFCGVVGTSSEGTFVTDILSYEYAPNGQDIAVGISNYTHKTHYRISDAECDVWQRVATCGFPEDAISIDGENKITTPLRAYKGIIQRNIREGHLALMPRSKGYELSFSPSPGLSGAPLFIYHKDHNEVVGVCVGSFKSEQVEDEITEVNESGETYTEKRVRITQYGIAESLTELCDWTPSFLGGTRLSDFR